MAISQQLLWQMMEIVAKSGNKSWNLQGRIIPFSQNSTLYPSLDNTWLHCVKHKKRAS